MNNKERLLNSDNKILAEELRHTFIENSASQYLDIEKWLESNNKELIYKGKHKIIDNKDYIVVGSDKIYGKELFKVIDPELSVIKYVEKGA